MAATLWQLAYTPAGGTTTTQTPAQWGIEDIELEYITQDADKMRFKAHQAFDDPDLFGYGASLDLLMNGRRVFAGRVVKAPRRGDPDGESVSYEVAGPWWWLDQLIFEQMWRMPQGYDPTGGLLLVQSPFTRVILGKDIENMLISAARCVEEVFAFIAAGNKAPVALGAHADMNYSLPAQEARDLSCAQVIKRLLRWSPDIYTIWDVSGPTPMLTLMRRTSTAPVSFAVGQIVKIPNLTPRYDLKPSCVCIRFELNNTLSTGSGPAQTIPQIITQLYPATGVNIYAPDALRMTAQLEGSSVTEIQQRVITRLIDIHSQTWWEQHLSYLKASAIQSYTLDTESASLDLQPAEDPENATPGGVLYDQELVDGSVAPWMQKSVSLAVASINATLQITDPDTGIVSTRTDRLTTRIRTTNATTGIYYTTTDSRPAEVVPPQLAQVYYTALSTLQYDGELMLQAEEWDGSMLVGTPVNLTGFARTEWASMNTGVVKQSVHLDTAAVTLTIGPAKHLGLDDWVQLAQPTWAKTYETGRIGSQRQTGRLSGDTPPELGRNHGGADSTSTILSSGAAITDFQIMPIDSGNFRVTTGHVNGVESNYLPQFSCSGTTYVYVEATFNNPSGEQILTPYGGVTINVTSNLGDLQQTSERTRRVLIGIVTPGQSPSPCVVQQVQVGGIYIPRPPEIASFEVRSTGSGANLGWYMEQGFVRATYNDTSTNIEKAVGATTGTLGDGTIRIGVQVDIAYEYDTVAGTDFDTVTINDLTVTASVVSGKREDTTWQNYNTGGSFGSVLEDSNTIMAPCCIVTTAVAPVGIPVLAPEQEGATNPNASLVFPLADITVSGGVIVSVVHLHKGDIELDVRPHLEFVQTVSHTGSGGSTGS